MSRDHKQYFVGVGLDISECKQLEDQLRQAQKMEPMGTLTGGIDHDFNNIPTASIGNGNPPNTKMAIDDPLQHNVDQILSSASRAAQLMQDLPAVSGKQIINPQQVNLNEIIRKLEPFLVRLIREDVWLMTDLTDKDATVQADSGQIEQALINLATNARDAMPDGGTLHIDTDLIDLDDEFVRTHPGSKRGKYAMIFITDSGTGMDEKTRQKIYEPFLTTKEVGKGTGLGLAMVYGMVKQHNGYIDVTSEVGKGTTFVIYLPAVQAEIPKAKLADAVSVKGSRETILVAGDDEAIRGLIKDMLQEFGYAVILAEDGEDALNKFRENRDKIQLLLFDVIMPKKDGKEVYEEIKGINPAVKAIFLSGYEADRIHREKVLEEGLNFIIKPFAVNTLLDEVRLMLDSRCEKRTSGNTPL
jgi:nitrogen-specific signal transduction histidine kinase/ActR/RegA family two-component response regulator